MMMFNTYNIINFYSWVVESIKKVSSYVEDTRIAVLKTILDGTYTHVTYYDFYMMKKTVLRNNTRPFAVTWILFKKYVLGMDIIHDVSIGSVQVPKEHHRGSTMIKLVYFENGKETHLLTRDSVLNEYDLQRIREQTVHRPFMYAIASNRHTVTRFVNSHLSSFDRTNAITLWDIYGILVMDGKIRNMFDGVLEQEAELKLIDDDTLEEIKYKINQVIVFTI